MENPFEQLNTKLDELQVLFNNKTTVEPETILSKKEVTELLGITINTLSKYTKEGTIPAFGIGTRVLYKKSDVLNSLIKIN
jgi:excisionase family DNA binding protein